MQRLEANHFVELRTDHKDNQSYDSSDHQQIGKQIESVFRRVVKDNEGSGRWNHGEGDA